LYAKLQIVQKSKHFSEHFVSCQLQHH